MHSEGMGSPHLVDVTMFMSPSSGGVKRYLQEKQGWLSRFSRWRHSVVAPVCAQAGIVPVPGLPLPFSQGYKLVLRRRAAARLLESLQPDLIEAGDPYRLAWSTLDAAAALGIPSVAFCHSNLESLAAQALGKTAARAARIYMQHLYSQFDLVLAPSDWMCGHLRNNGITRVERQPLGVDTRIFSPAQRDPAWRAQLGLTADARILVYAGRFAPEKRLETLAAAVDLLGAPYTLVAIGAGSSVPVGRRLRILPYEKHAHDLARALASADAFVHGGDQETFGLAALEGMACGLPLVARPVAGLAELVNDRTGMPVAGAQATDFAEAIDCLFSGDLAARSAAARDYALLHDWECVMPSLFLRYRRLLASTRPVSQMLDVE